MIELTVLGSGTSLPTMRRGQPGYAVRVGKEYLLFELGSGTMRRLAEAGIQFNRVAHCFLSHGHVDHVADLAPLLFAKRNPDLKMNDDLTVHGWRGSASYVERLSAAYGEWLAPRGYGLEVKECDGAPIDGAGWRVTPYEVEHTPGALGFRIETEYGHTVAYSGDTDACDAVVELGRKADILVLECSFPDKWKVEGHLTPSECGRIATAAGCRRLVLSHFYPVCDKHDIAGDCQRHWKGELVLAEDLMRIAVGPRS